MDNIIDIFNLFKDEIKRAVNADDQIEFDITLPKLKENGDISTNAALKLSSRLNKSPIEMAKFIAESVDKDIIKAYRVETAAPGFINFYLNNDWLRIIGDMVLNNGISIAQKPIEKKLVVDVSSEGSVNSKARAEAYLKILKNICEIRGCILEEGARDSKPPLKLGDLKLLKDEKEQDIDINDLFDEHYINFYSISKTYKNDIEVKLDNAFINNTSNPYFYITYVYIRAANIVSILGKQGYSISGKDVLSFSSDKASISPEGRELIFRILQLEEVLDEAVKHKEPFKLFDYIYSYSELFNRYNSNLLLRNQTKTEILSNLYILTVVEKITSEILKLMMIIK